MDEETNAGDDSNKPEQLFVGKWQLVEYSSPEGMIQIEEGKIIEFTSDGKVLFEDYSVIYRFEADKLCLSEPLTEEPYLIYTYEFEEERLLLEMFSTTLPSDDTNPLPNLLIYQRVKETQTDS